MYNADIVQLVEQQICNLYVIRSIRIIDFMNL